MVLRAAQGGRWCAGTSAGGRRQGAARHDPLRQGFSTEGAPGALLGACAGAGPQEGAGGAPARGAAGPVDYATFASGASLEATRETGERFGARFPGAQVNVIVPPPGQAYGDLLLAMTAAGTPPDVMLVNNDQVALYATQGLIGPLEPLLNRDRREMGDYFPLGLRVYRFQEQQVCIPGDLNAVGIYFNRTLLDQAGVAPPSTDFRAAGWTADELLALARHLLRPECQQGQVLTFSAVPGTRAGLELRGQGLSPRSGGEGVEPPQGAEQRLGPRRGEAGTGQGAELVAQLGVGHGAPGGAGGVLDALLQRAPVAQGQAHHRRVFGEGFVLDQG